METSAVTPNKPQTADAVQTHVVADRITSVAREFEALFTSMMLKSMRKTIGENPLMPTSMGEKIYTGMLDDEYAKIMSNESTFGLAGLIEKELRSHEESGADTKGCAMPAWMIDNRFIPTGIRTEAQEATNVAQLMARVDKWDGIIDNASQVHGVDKNLVAAVIAQESGGNQFAVSRAGAKGLMQLMNATALGLGVVDSFDPQENVDAGVKYLRQLLNKYDGDEIMALASYNAGPGAVEKYNGMPPYRETRDYVSSVLALRRQFENASLQTAVRE